MSDFLGRGWAFPPGPGGRGGISLVSDAQNIEKAIKIILSTPIGQRVMRPTFGSRLHELVFAPFNAETIGRADLYVRDALGFWEPRIQVTDVAIRQDYGHPTVLFIEIFYRIKATHDERSLVYPFYQLPGE